MMEKILLSRAADIIEERIIESIAESHAIGRPLASCAASSLKSVRYLQEARAVCEKS